jgi:hypothetical protein
MTRYQSEYRQVYVVKQEPQNTPTTYEVYASKTTQQYADWYKNQRLKIASFQEPVAAIELAKKICPIYRNDNGKVYGYRAIALDAWGR